MSYVDNEPIYLQTLLSLPDIGHKTMKYVLQQLSLREINFEKISSLSEIRKLLFDIQLDMEKYQYIRYYVPELNDLERAYDRAKKIITNCKKMDVQVIPFYDAQYPELLQKIDDPPIILYAKGNYNYINNNNLIAVVGTRSPTEYGIDTARRISQFLVNKDVAVVGGLAEGIDTAAHESCIDAEGHTVAVLAHGHDKIYPKKNEKLFERIIEKDGCILSEYPPGMSFSRGNFIQRDRIQSGISSGIIVVETDIEGGTMHTVKYCLEQGRYLGCIKHPDKYIERNQTRGNQIILNIDTLHKYRNKMDLELYKLVQKKRNLIFSIEPESDYSIIRFIKNTKQSLPTPRVTNIFNYYINIEKANVTMPINASNVTITMDNKKKKRTKRKKVIEADQTALKNIFET